MSSRRRRVDGKPIRLRTSAERETLGAATAYARTHEHDLGTPAEAAYLAALPDARREICRRLVRGLLRGRPTGLPDSAFVDPANPAVPDAPSPLEALTGDRLRSLVDPDGCRRLAVLPFPSSKTALIAPIAARHGYDRFRFVGPTYRWSSTAAGRDGENGGRLAHPVDLVPLLSGEGVFVDADQAERIRAELAESVANLALARLATPVLAGEIDQRVDPAVESPLEALARGVPSADAATAFERIVTDGHPFHPAGKIRRGMTAADGLAYAPEFTERIDLRFVGVDREYALETRAEASESERGRLTDRLYATFDGLEGALERAVPAGRAGEEYAVVPVHPMQFHRTIPDRYADPIEDGRVVPIPDYATPATPQLNLRTVVPYATDRTADGPLPHLKLAIPVQTTNVVRTLSPHAVTNGPQVTDVVRAIERRESLDELGLLAEPAATCYSPPGGPHPEGEAFDDARHLSGLLRKNPSAHPLVPEDGVPVVASSLVADVPTTGRPLVRELLERYGERIGAATVADAARAFLERYVAVVVPEQLRLLSAYGVALESHLQNSLVVFDGPEPVATLVRDLGGIRVSGDRLADRGLAVDPYPDSDVDAADETALYRKLYYALFQNHLAELVATVARETPVDERDCWTLVRERCDRAFEGLRAEDAAPSARLDRDRAALLEQPTAHKALTAMRLRGKRHEYVTSEISNPLAAAGRDRIVP
ncbi:IucA/IucC family siderophore biosynthesis protein [Natronococcus sp. JC468]|uniref:IucA/IucC family protein n=1 Tax=Natronococcus sp. JC468 TaxID=1961921 RepID=UPI00143ADA9E|nr:IucA/IucC family protein [Natronococcus sp. JC468]NKE34437.1 IucA/IucC family siderophore biosynthesis protein [Natronococcus sp. JC468]